MIVENGDISPDIFNIRFNGKWVTTTIPAGAVCYLCLVVCSDKWDVLIDGPMNCK